MFNIKYYIYKRKKIFISIGLILLSLILWISFSFSTKKTIVLASEEGSISVDVYGYATTSDVLAKADIQMGPYDKIEGSLKDYVVDNETINISYDFNDTYEQEVLKMLELANRTDISARLSALIDTEYLIVNNTGSETNTILINGKIYAYSRIMDIEATAYDPSSCYPYDGIHTADGSLAKEYYTIAAPRDIPFGTMVYIPYFADAPNNGIFEVEDRGGAIKGNIIDIFFKSHYDAIKFGRRNLTMYILK